MDRIVIIGNGFDLAHELKTSYKDFFEYLKGKIFIEANFNKDDIPALKTEGDFSDLSCLIGVYKDEDKDVDVFKTCSRGKSIYFKSLFKNFEKYNYWSNLEEHYFNCLFDNQTNAELINKEFKLLCYLLEGYLINKIEHNNEIDYFGKFGFLKSFFAGNNELGMTFNNTYIVTFNYTNKLLELYLHEYKDDKSYHTPIFINGKLRSRDNPIIFGYGDENSEKYKKLEELKDDNLLVNFKTFRYLRNNNYSQVLGILNNGEDKYVQIIGHSCETCDKTLLKTIFEHDSVKYIEPTYHQDESYYFEKLYAISRIFENNTLMREKVLNLGSCWQI